MVVDTIKVNDLQLEGSKNNFNKIAENGVLDPVIQHGNIFGSRKTLPDIRSVFIKDGISGPK